MERFAIVVDSSADLTQEQYDAMHIDGFIPLSFAIDGKEYLSYPDERELTAEELYATLRNTKAVVGTSQPNPGRIEDALEALLRQGKDVLYIAFTSGLSCTCSSAQLVAEGSAGALSRTEAVCGGHPLCLLRCGSSDRTGGKDAGSRLFH
mgnify:CR=1 FL=1